jgi:hypothetical protein
MRILCKVKPSSLDQSISPDLSSHKFKAHKIRRSVALDPQVAPDPPLPKENVEQECAVTKQEHQSASRNVKI